MIMRNANEISYVFISDILIEIFLSFRDLYFYRKKKSKSTEKSEGKIENEKSKRLPMKKRVVPMRWLQSWVSQDLVQTKRND